MTRRGSVLLIVLVIVAIATMVAAGLMFTLRAELQASSSGARNQQAFLAAQSGLTLATSVVSLYAADPAVWGDNPELFQDRLVMDDGTERWYFSVYRADQADPTIVRYGVSDENGKINLNRPDAAMLAALPGMTEELVDSLLDYTDSDSNPRPAGAEQDYYDKLPSPYVIKNGPLVTLEELLLVRGFTGQIVYGEDANLNGRLDPNEDDRDDTFPPDDGDGKLARGLAGLCTTFSIDTNTDSQNRQRINLNTAAAAQLTSAGLSAQTVEFIEAYRSEGNMFRDPSELLNMTYTLKNARGGSTGGEGRFGGRGGRTGGAMAAGTVIQSGVGAEQLPAVMDRLTVLPPNAPLVGLVNVNTAPLEVLAALPGLDSNLAAKVIEARAGLTAEAMGNTAWLVTQGVLEAASYKQVAPRLGSRSRQFRIRSVGYGVPSGQFRVLEAVVDTMSGTPRVVYFRELTRLGLSVGPGQPPS
jgi:type II secretory pathway component PulK